VKCQIDLGRNREGNVSNLGIRFTVRLRFSEELDLQYPVEGGGTG